jgi:hypothetical protein
MEHAGADMEGGGGSPAVDLCCSDLGSDAGLALTAPHIVGDKGLD